MAKKPYMTSDTLVESVKRRIMLPSNQSTYSYNDILDTATEELQLSAVPQIIESHQEYFVYKLIVPLVNNVNRYTVPNRAIGMALRDVFWSDTNGNYYEMTRIAPDDKAFFQQNVGNANWVNKYYLEGNEIVLAPQQNIASNGTNLNFFFYLRPNALVRPNRAATIESFKKDIVVTDYSLLQAGDLITITTGNQTPSPTVLTLTAIASGSPTSTEFLIGASNNATANNISTAINNAAITGITSLVEAAGEAVKVTYTDLTTTFDLSRPNSTITGMTVDNDYLYIKFDSLPIDVTDPETNITDTDVFTDGQLVDFLQTNPGHRTYTYDVTLVSNNANIGKFAVSQLQTYLTNSSSGTLEFWPIQVGDYICVQNECIIPQIPPELHVALAERTAARILASIGDKDGLMVSQAKIAEMNKAQATLIDNRVEGSPVKVFNRFALMRQNKRGGRWRL